MPSLLTAGISDDDAQTRATSSMTMHVASESAPSPPYSSGMCTAWKPALTSASRASSGIALVLVDLGGVRRDLLLGERADGLAQRLVLLAEPVGAEVGFILSPPSSDATMGLSSHGSDESPTRRRSLGTRVTPGPQR